VSHAITASDGGLEDFEAFRRAATEAGVHTVELGTPDSQGHLRGKRVPVQRFFDTVARRGVNIADAMFVFDMANDLPENEFVNMSTGYLDCRLVPDLASGRLLSHRPGYALVLADVEDAHGQPHPLAPRNVLRAQVERCHGLGGPQPLTPVVATELEFYLCTPDWLPVQDHIQYSSLTDGLEIEMVLAQMRSALLGAGIEVESSNAEYGPGQFEINTGPADALTMADNTVLFKSIVKQVAVQHGLRATFMPKPWWEQSGSGLHVHTSLTSAGFNAFAASSGRPNGVMSRWLAGQLANAQALMLLAAPTINGCKRIQPYTFAPTHVTWGLDNRTVLARCIVEEGSQANRVEFRAAGADANPYLLIAGLLAAGADGLERDLELPPMSVGDLYTDPGEAVALATTLPDAIDRFAGSPLAARLGEVFASSYASIARAEVALAGVHSPDVGAVNDWERARYLAHC
jgi:glutamine synthetase